MRILCFHFWEMIVHAFSFRVNNAILNPVKYLSILTVTTQLIGVFFFSFMKETYSFNFLIKAGGCLFSTCSQDLVCYFKCQLFYFFPFIYQIERSNPSDACAHLLYSLWFTSRVDPTRYHYCDILHNHACT